MQGKETISNLKLAVISISSGSLLLRHSQTSIFDAGDDPQKKKKTTASNVPIVAIDVTTSLSLTGNRDWVLCIEYEVFI